MTLRALTALALVAALGGTSAAQAQFMAGGSRLAGFDEQAIREACAGLEAQSRMSLTADVPDDIDNGDSAGEYALDRLPFTLRDCREAGYR